MYAELGALTLQREAAAAIAQAEALEAAVELENGVLSANASKLLTEKEITERTSNCVKAHSKLHIQTMDTPLQRVGTPTSLDIEEGPITWQSPADNNPHTLSGSQLIKPPKAQESHIDAYASLPNKKTLSNPLTAAILGTGRNPGLLASPWTPQLSPSSPEKP